MKNISADIPTGLGDSITIRDFKEKRCVEHKCDFVTLFREVKSDNGTLAYANPQRICPKCFDIAKLKQISHWKERPAGYIPFQEGTGKNGMLHNARMNGEMLTHNKGAV